MSWGASENQSSTKSGILSLSQEIAQLTAAGITLFVASGDGGSNPNPNSGDYSSSSPLSVEYPASDPNAIGVGGTAMFFNSSWVDTGEVVWNQLATSPSGASGGGISTVFIAPSWQTGTPSTTARCVPDVSALAAGASSSSFPVGGQIGALIVVTVTTGRNSSSSEDLSVGGTSLATPVWAAVATQINQARAAGGLSSLGALGPRIYPLAGTSAFTDITSGNNGAYSAGIGYDLCSGIGTPNVTNLLLALGGSIPPVVTAAAPAPAPAAGGGGGGGAPSLWFYGALALLLAVRRMARSALGPNKRVGDNALHPEADVLP
jgi:kumamolisin